MEPQVFQKFELENAYGLLIDTTVIKKENIRDMQKLPLYDDDVIAVAYPKCGITWTQYIIWEVLNGGIEPPSLMDMTTTFFPFTEVTGVKPILEMTSRPRTIKFHSPHSLVPKNDKAKYIVIFRNPFDCCVSYFHHLKQRYLSYHNQIMEFDRFFDCFITGHIGFGDYFDFVLSWYEKKNDPNILTLFYEQMKKDHEGTVLKIADFLGDKYSKPIREDPKLMSKIIHYSSFSYMKENLTLDKFIVIDKKEEEKPKKEGNKIEFFRKGVVGDWKTLFSEEQKKRMMEKFEEKFGGSPLIDLLSPP